MTKPPTEADRAEVVRLTLTGVANGRDIFDLVDDLAPYHPRNNTFPGEVFLELAADALALAGSESDRIVYEGIRERYLPECAFRTKHDHRASHYVLSAAAMIRAGIEPDLLGEVTWWRSDDLWVFSLYALVIYIRAASEKTGEEPGVIAARIAERSGVRLEGHTPAE